MGWSWSVRGVGWLCKWEFNPFEGLILVLRFLSGCGVVGGERLEVLCRACGVIWRKGSL